MKFQWEENDIVPGRMLKVPEAGETWMIAYFPLAVDDAKFALVSLMNGLIAGFASKDQMVYVLTHGELIPAEYEYKGPLAAQ